MVSRFELDMLLESVNSATKHVEALLKKIGGDTGPICLEEHFTGNKRLNSQVYASMLIEILISSVFCSS